MKSQKLFLFSACVVLLILWVPGLKYPIVSDSAQYALLGESIWHGKGYQLFDLPYAKHLPLHAILSYPLAWLFGFNIGMKIASLLGGFAVLIGAYLVGRDHFSPSVTSSGPSGKAVGIGTVLVLLIHHGFLWTTMVGSADLLFAALFLFGLWAYGNTDDDKRWYLLTGLCWGLACLTRYNGMPLLALYLLYGLIVRKDYRHAPFWNGFLLAFGLFSIWLMRNFNIFGNPLYTEYTEELGIESAGPIAQLMSNFFFYVSPLQNILPVLLVFALYGIWKQWREQALLLWGMVAVLMLTAIWWVQAMRFAFPAYPLLIMFGVWGVLQVSNRKAVVSIISLIVVTHLGAICLYTYGSCNAFFDRTLNIIQPNLGLTSEGFHAFHYTRGYINEYADENAYVLVSDEPKLHVWKDGVFRKDLQLTTDASNCPYYRITREPWGSEVVIYTTDDHPQTSVVLHSCHGSASSP